MQLGTGQSDSWSTSGTVSSSAEQLAKELLQTEQQKGHVHGTLGREPAPAYPTSGSHLPNPRGFEENKTKKMMRLQQARPADLLAAFPALERRPRS